MSCEGVGVVPEEGLKGLKMSTIMIFEPVLTLSFSFDSREFDIRLFFSLLLHFLSESQTPSSKLSPLSLLLSSI